MVFHQVVFTLGILDRKFEGVLVIEIQNLFRSNFIKVPARRCTKANAVSWIQFHEALRFWSTHIVDFIADHGKLFRFCLSPLCHVEIALGRIIGGNHHDLLWEVRLDEGFQQLFVTTIRGPTLDNGDIRIKQVDIRFPLFYEF